MGWYIISADSGMGFLCPFTESFWNKQTSRKEAGLWRFVLLWNRCARSARLSREKEESWLSARTRSTSRDRAEQIQSGMYAQNCALTIYDEIKTCRRADVYPDMRTGLFRWNIALNTGSGFVRISPAPFQYRKAGRAHLQGWKSRLNEPERLSAIAAAGPTQSIGPS